MSEQTCIIVGGGHAAAQLAPSLRQEGWTGKILVVTEEPCLPYNRPPLSKSFLAQEKSIDDLLIRHDAAYEKAGIEFLLGVRAQRIDRDNKTLTLNNGQMLDYDKLALVTGGRPRKLDVGGSDLPGIYYLRNIADVMEIQPEVRPGRRVVIVGGGYIGLETAAMLRKMGLDVTLVESAKRILERVTAPEVSAFYARLHREEGVEVVDCAQVSAFGGEDRVREVQCADGRTFPADFVVVGIGILPNDELAREAGLKTGNGIHVDATCLTSDPDIVAAGDCARFFIERYQQELRLESVQNAVDQARVAAANVCGKGKEYNALPWFWSDQYDVKLQIAGLSLGYDQVVIRGDIEKGRKFSACYLCDGRLLAVDAVNSPQDFMFGKRLIMSDQEFDAEALADSSRPLKMFLK